MNAALCFLSFLFLFPSSASAHAQAPNSKQPGTTKTSPPKIAKDPEAERALRERRAQARSLLIALAVDARTFHDQSLRARSLARIADALWQVDAEQARLLFRKAWEAAELADQESERKLKEEVQRQKAQTGGGFAINLPPNVRREVLRLVVVRDRALGEEFLDKLKTQEENAAVKAVSRSSDSVNQRLSVAIELLEAGDTERALQLADPLLGTVNVQTINFLTYVRERNATLADARYNALLRQAVFSPQSDANTVSLLSSYIFTPHLMITFTGNGVSSSQSKESIVPADVSPELRAAFFQAAESILSRPIPPPGQEQGTAGIEGKYLVIKRLLPLFEQSALPQQVESLRIQMEALNALISDNTRRRDDEWVRRGTRSEPAEQEREQMILDRIERAKTSAERDQLYIQLASRAAGRSDIRAREFTSKIEDSELRKQLQIYIDATLSQRAIEKKQFDLALTMAEKGELSHLHRAWLLSEVAKQLVKTDRQKALDLIEDAAAEARRIEVGHPDSPKAFLAIANAIGVVDPARVWDATFDAVKAANSAEGFTGEDGELAMKFQSKGQSSVSTHDVAEFDVAGIFRMLADKDYERAVELARGFQAEGPRAVATIAIARAVLEPKKVRVEKIVN